MITYNLSYSYSLLLLLWSVGSLLLYSVLSTILNLLSIILPCEVL